MTLEFSREFKSLLPAKRKKGRHKPLNSLENLRVKMYIDEGLWRIKVERSTSKHIEKRSRTMYMSVEDL